MLHFNVKVLFVQDENRDLPIKDKNGVPTQLTRSYRFTTIQGLVKDPDLKCDRPVVVKGVDLPSSFEVPKSGSDWVTPEVNSLVYENGTPIIGIRA